MANSIFEEQNLKGSYYHIIPFSYLLVSFIYWGWLYSFFYLGLGKTRSCFVGYLRSSDSTRDLLLFFHLWLGRLDSSLGNYGGTLKLFNYSGRILNPSACSSFLTRSTPFFIALGNGFYVLSCSMNVSLLVY